MREGATGYTVLKIRRGREQKGGLTLWLRVLKALKAASRRLVSRRQRQVRLAGSHSKDWCWQGVTVLLI